DRVVDVFLETTLTARQLLQVASGRLRAGLLKLSAKALVSPAIVLNRRAGVDVAVAGGGDVGHTQIDTERSIDIALVRVRNVAHRQQVERALAVHEVGFALPVRQQFTLALARLIGDVQSEEHRSEL